MSVHRFLANNRNLFRTATVAASAVKTAANAVFPGAPQRAGSSRGTVALTGAYTGAAAATFDVEIVGSAATASRASAPIFTGAGSSTLAGLAVTDAVAPQTFEIVLKSLGVDTETAAVAFYGVTLRAKTAGAAGNDITLSVDTSAITKTSLNVATLAELPAAADGSTHSRAAGPEWDFGGAYELTAAGTLNPNTKRIAFGADPQVYRSWRATEQGQEVYYFDPPIARAVAAETLVFEVTGSYTVTVTDGVTPEVFGSVVTLYDLLANLVTSGHVEVDGVINEDRTPGGMAVDDLPLRTASFALPPETAGSAYVGELESVTAGANAVTQTLEITCIDNSVLGAERWSVNGSVSGALAGAVTDALYASSTTAAVAVGFKIPRKIPGGFPTAGAIHITDSSFAGDPAPHLCDDVFRPVVGVAATNKTFTLTWVERPGDECDCEALKGSVTGGPDPDCLGVDVRALSVSTSDYRYRQLVTQQQKIVSDFIAAQTLAGPVSAASDQYDQQLAELIDIQVHRALGTIFGNSAAVLDYSARVDSTAYTEGDYINVSGDLFVAANDGTSAGSAPSFDTTDYGDTTTDNDITWIYFGKAPLELVDDMLAAEQTDFTVWDGLALPGAIGQYQNVTYAATGGFVTPTSGNDHYYKLLWQQATAGTWNAEPTWGTSGGVTVETASDGAKRGWQDMGAYTGASIEDITAAALAGKSHALADFAKKYRELANEVIAAAQLDLGKAEASGDGAACWQDDPTATAYFAVKDGNRSYMPLFPNRYWHSARKTVDPDTGAESIVSTQEAGFALLMCDTDLLAVGDTVSVTISDVVQHRSYQVDDRFRLPIVNRSPLALQGGVDGDDTHVWGVRGTVDGALGDYSVVHESEGAYSDSGVSWDSITRGATPNQIGDKFSFAVERTQFRWRKDGGSYSSAADITAAAVALSDGLSALFTPGAGVSFEAGDLFPFTVRQPYAPAQVQAGSSDGWQWSGATAELTLTAASDQTIDAVAICRHSLPEGATITARGLDVSDVEQWAVALTWRRGPIVHVFESDQSCRKLKIELASATDGAVAWLWAGVALDFTRTAADITLVRQYQMARAPAGGRARYIGQGEGGEIAWENFFRQTDADNLYALLDHVKQAGDEPIVFVPHILHPAEARLVRIDDDQISVQDHYKFTPNDDSQRLLSVRLPLAAVVS